MNQQIPLISVLIGVHVRSSYLFQSIESLVSQTYSNLEIIIIVNGSEYNSLLDEIKLLLVSLVTCPGRSFKVLHTGIAQLSNALNLGLDNSSGDFIARMDSDDISLPNRIKKQFRFLVDNNLELVGSQLILINSNSDFIGFQSYPIQPRNINRLLPFKNCFAHNTILAKKNLFFENRGYLGLFSTEDYYLWMRMQSSRAIRWQNMRDKLVLYRIHSGQSSQSISSFSEISAISLLLLLQQPSLIRAIAFVTHLLRYFMFLVKS
jgi:glycosyltransferase involved in cell wall biosynthesis